jgi:hypothetical protein
MTTRFGNGIQSMLEGRGSSHVVPATTTTTTTIAEFTPESYLRLALYVKWLTSLPVHVFDRV